MQSGMVVCEDYDAFNPYTQRLKNLRRVDYAFYFGNVPFNLPTWAAPKVMFTSSLPLVAIAGYVTAPILSLQNKDAARPKDDMVYVTVAVMQIQVVYEDVVVAQLAAQEFSYSFFAFPTATINSVLTEVKIKRG